MAIACHSPQGASVYTNYCLSFSTGCLCLYQLLPVILHRVPLSILTIACHSPQGASVYTNYCLSFSTGCLCLYQLLPVILHRVPLSIPTIACHDPQGASVYKHYCLSFSTGRLCLQLLPVILHRVPLSIPTIACHSPQGTAVYTNYCLSFSTRCPPCTLLYPALSIPTWPFKSPATTQRTSEHPIGTHTIVGDTPSPSSGDLCICTPDDILDVLIIPGIRRLYPTYLMKNTFLCQLEDAKKIRTRKV